MENLYHYKATVTSVHDGDTCTADIDLGLGVWVRGEKIRLARINAPEIHGEGREAGIRSRDFLRDRIGGREVVVQTIKDKREKYGRYLAEILSEDENGNPANINDLLVAEGHAAYAEY